MILSELFPRRESCQIFNKKIKKRLKISLRSAKRKKKTRKIFFLYNFKKWLAIQFSTFRKLSFPFGACTAKKKLCLITEKNFIKQNSKYFRKIIIPKKSKFTSMNIFLRNFRLKNFLFMLDYKLRKKYTEFLKKSRINYRYIKIKRNPSLCLLESFCSFYIFSSKGPSVSLAIELKTCVKKYINNYGQINGNFLEYCKESIYNLNKIEIKKEKSEKTTLFFSK
jgi:hypothetical protein